MLTAAGAIACTPAVRTARPESSQAPVPRSTAPRSPRVTPPTEPPPSELALYEPAAGDTYRNAKRVAGRFAQALATYPEGRPIREIVGEAARRADAAFEIAHTVEQARPLVLDGARSTGEVVYAQLGGLAVDTTPARASVMVVVRQHLTGQTGEDATVTRTVDVRLINRGDQWRLEALADPGGQPVQRRDGRLSPVARAVLDDDRIELPDSARWDIHAGRIDQRLLRTMRDMASLFPYAVTVLRSGHPHNVFGTDLVSGHTLGRGVDIWRVAGQPVVLQGDSKGSPAYRLTQTLLEDLDVPELGSPWDLDGPPVPGTLKPSFTNAVHADHIHVAFKAA
jgi:hypothetical protein